MIWVVFLRIISPVILSFSTVSAGISSWVGVPSWRFCDLEDNSAVAAMLDLQLRLGPIGISLSS